MFELEIIIDLFKWFCDEINCAVSLLWASQVEQLLSHFQYQVLGFDQRRLCVGEFCFFED
jgi:hypothetical protein